jgi:hypothetical protein
MPDTIFTRWLSWEPAQWDEIRDGFMEPFAWWFNGDPEWAARYPSIDANPGYDAAFWFIPIAGAVSDDPSWMGYRRWWCSFLVDDEGDITPLGEYWQSGVGR